jgi:cytochrome c oxidase subunit II
MRRLRTMAATMTLLVSAACGLLAQDAGEIKVTAKKYEFEPAQIRVKKGDHVKLLITAVDHDHGFKLAAFHVDQKLKKGDVEFTPDQTGTFPFECSKFCGMGHKNMKAN